MAIVYKPSTGEKVAKYIIIFILTIITLATMFPFLNIVATSLNDSIDTIKGGLTIYPRVPTLGNYQQIFQDKGIGVSRAYTITLLRTVIGASLSVCFTMMAAYGIARNDLPGRKYIMTYMLIPMFFGAGMIPGYVNIYKLGLMNNFWVYVLPTSFGIYHMILTMNFIRGIPMELEEAAKIDGAGEALIFFKVILPLSVPIIATISLMFMVMQWNAWMDAFMYVTKTSLHPMQMVLARMIILNEQQQAQILMSGGDYTDTLVTPQALKACAITITILPMLCIYPFIQKFFIKGMLIGSVKG
jgi:putative aldouronate transport system permease protein